MLATPTSLVALLKVVAYGWKQTVLADNAAEIRRLGEELYKRLAVFGEHLGKLGKSLGSSVESFNKAVGSLEQQVMPAARRFPELGLRVNRDLEPIEPVANLTRIPRHCGRRARTRRGRGRALRPLDAHLSQRARFRRAPRATGAGCSPRAEARAPLLGIYALLRRVAGADGSRRPKPAWRSLKLAWWQEEMRRLAAGAPVHPISALSRRAAARRRGRFRAAARRRECRRRGRSRGAPLEHGAELEPHAQRAVAAIPLVAGVAARRRALPTTPACGRCTRALAAARISGDGAARLSARGARRARAASRSMSSWRRASTTTDLAADPPPPHLQDYLDALRGRAAGYFESAARRCRAPSAAAVATA